MKTKKESSVALKDLSVNLAFIAFFPMYAATVVAFAIGIERRPLLATLALVAAICIYKAIIKFTFSNK